MSEPLNRRAFLSWGLKGALVAPFALAGCQHVGTMTEIAVATGSMDQATADALNKSADAVARTFEDITPRQEYFIGRAVAATILSKYKPVEDEAATRYLNQLGHALALSSNRPLTFGGYHFMLLDSEEINGMAAPGGLIFLTRGLVACCETEDALAGVVAHEIGHVEHRHGLQAIQTARITEAVIAVGSATATVMDAGELNELTQAFGGSVDDITRTLINSGYSRDLETEADQAAVRTMERIGYNPAGLVQALQSMNKRLKPGGSDFASTHPSPLDRIGDIQQVATAMPKLDPPKARAKRFKKALAALA